MKDSIIALNNITLSAGSGTALNPTKVDLSAKNWSQVTLQAVLTNGATPPTNGQPIIIYYAFFDTSILNTDAPTNFNNQKRPFVLFTNSSANNVQDLTTSPLDATGDYLYLWINKPSTGQSVTVTLNVVEAGVSSTPSIITSSTATITTPTALASTFTILASNPSRKGGSFYNNSTQDIKVKQGSAASTSDWSFIINPSGFYSFDAPLYTGIYTGFCDSAVSGTVQVTELT